MRRCRCHGSREAARRRERLRLSAVLDTELDLLVVVGEMETDVVVFVVSEMDTEVVVVVVGEMDTDVVA